MAQKVKEKNFFLICKNWGWEDVELGVKLIGILVFYVVVS